MASAVSSYVPPSYQQNLAEEQSVSSRLLDGFHLGTVYGQGSFEDLEGNKNFKVLKAELFFEKMSQEKLEKIISENKLIIACVKDGRLKSVGISPEFKLDADVTNEKIALLVSEKEIGIGVLTKTIIKQLNEIKYVTISESARENFL